MVVHVLCTHKHVTAVHEGNYVLNHTRSGKVTIQQFVQTEAMECFNCATNFLCLTV